MVPLEVWGEFDDDLPIDAVKERLEQTFDMLMESTDFVHDAWQRAQVEHMP